MSSSSSGSGAGAARAPAAAAASSPAESASSSSAPLKKLEELQFDNLALRALPIDPERRNFTRQVRGACFSLVEPTPVKNPQLVCYSPDVLRWIELDEREAARPEFVEYMSGNRILPGARPAAHCYCGHQFGHFSGQLGDGATMYLGEIVTSRGERVEIQFKGAGKTPYSRNADGRKVLRSSLREFLCSEAHHYLGIPTTRAGTIVTSDSRVERDLFYDGNVILERATIITRLAPSFIRFGSFEIAKQTDPTTDRAGPSAGNTQIVNQLLDYVVDTFYRDATASVPESEGREGKYLAFFRELMRRTALLVAKWQSVGWCHGVLNTDNMSILGLTIDYGPFGFMEAFDPEYICNGSDSEGRYRYEAQPEICGWNLMKLSQMLEPFVPRNKLRAIVGEFEDMFLVEYDRIMRRKLGVGLWQQAEAAQAAASSSQASITETEGKSDAAEAASPYDSLIKGFFTALESTAADFTNSFRCLAAFEPDNDVSFRHTLDYLLSQCATPEAKAASLAPRIPPGQMRMIMHLLQTQPHIFRQPGMEEQMAVIQAEIDRGKQREQLASISPDDKAQQDRAAWEPWLRRYESVLRDELAAAVRSTGRLREDLLRDRRRVQNSSNPKYILRNWIAQEVINAAEKGDFTPVRECLERLRDPYDVDDLGELMVASPHAAAAEAEAKEPLLASAAGAHVSIGALEQEACRGKVHASSQCPQSSQSNRAEAPPDDTKCTLHWNRKRPDWANTLKVT